MALQGASGGEPQLFLSGVRSKKIRSLAVEVFAETSDKMWQPGLPQLPSSTNTPRGTVQEMAQDGGWYSPHLGAVPARGSPSGDAVVPAPVGDANHALHLDPGRAQFRADTAFQNVPISMNTTAHSALGGYTEGGLPPPQGLC